MTGHVNLQYAARGAVALPRNPARMRAAEPPGTGRAAGLIPPGHPPPAAGPRHRAGPAAG